MWIMGFPKLLDIVVYHPSLHLQPVRATPHALNPVRKPACGRALKHVRARVATHAPIRVVHAQQHAMRHAPIHAIHAQLHAQLHVGLHALTVHAHTVRAI